MNDRVVPKDPESQPIAPATPMMAQYHEIKTANPDCLLFYRMGDFYELFFDDAIAASAALGIALTKRGKHQGDDIPMCGVPVATADDYLQRLIAAGFRVAVCEQLEDPQEARKRGAKSVVRRDVIRLVTPGTITEEKLLDARRANLLAALAYAQPGSNGEGRFGYAAIDISTGEFRVGEVAAGRLGAELARIEPSEIILPDQVFDAADLKGHWVGLSASMSPLPRDLFDGANAERRVARYFGIETTEVFGTFTRLELTAAAAVLGYVERTQIGARPTLSPPRREREGAAMTMDAATRTNLELLRTLSGERKGSLLWAVDRTVTAAGGRLLAERLSGPLTDVDAIITRLDAVATLVETGDLREDLRHRLKAAPDMARALSRLALGRGSPRDLGAIRSGLSAAADVADLLTGALPSPPQEIAEAATALAAIDPDLRRSLDGALADELPIQKADGNFVRAGWHAELDETRALRDESRSVIAGLQTYYAQDTGIRTLKVKHNAVLGYFIEASAANGEKLFQPPLNARFHHRQTLAGAVRFSTNELADLDRKIGHAADQALRYELEVFAKLSDAALNHAAAIKAAGQALAALDVTAGFAELAIERRHVRPEIDGSLTFEIGGGRHPVVEQALEDTGGGPFVANGCDLSPVRGSGPGCLWLITGPNMGGKSTYLRQNALIALLAQVGAFVPADTARIGVVDRLFSRVGASDDLARGRSTFMVEMVETAAILTQAGERSLVILDEIGRGTATYDGLSIAWAAVEHLHDGNRCRGLFATHYHELPALAETLPRLRNATLKVKEWKGEVVFLHEVGPGAADRSYGVQVAKLAGLPRAVIDRATAVLAQLEADERSAPTRLVDDLPLFRVAPPAPEPKTDELGMMLDAIIPDDLTPREAIEALYRLKAKRLERK